MVFDYFGFLYGVIGNVIDYFCCVFWFYWYNFFSGEEYVLGYFI